MLTLPFILQSTLQINIDWVMIKKGGLVLCGEGVDCIAEAVPCFGL